MPEVVRSLASRGTSGVHLCGDQPAECVRVQALAIVCASSSIFVQSNASSSPMRQPSPANTSTRSRRAYFLASSEPRRKVRNSLRLSKEAAARFYELSQHSANFLSVLLTAPEQRAQSSGYQEVLSEVRNVALHNFNCSQVGSSLL